MDVETLCQIFPEVDEQVIDSIHASAQNPNPAYVANVLESAAKKGKVPDQNYTQLAAERMIQDDALPDWAEEEDVMRGMQANQQANSNQWMKKALQADKDGDLQRLVKLHNDMHHIGSDSQLDPTRTDMPDNVKQATIITANAMMDEIDRAAREGERETLTSEYLPAVSGIQVEGLRNRLQNKINNNLQLMDNQGSEFEKVKNLIQDDGNTPAEVERILDQAERGNWDLTFKQVEKLAEIANEWMREYEQVMQKADELEKAAEEGE